MLTLHSLSTGVYVRIPHRQSAGLGKEAAENIKSDTIANFNTCMSNLLELLTAHYTEFSAQDTLQREHD